MPKPPSESLTFYPAYCFSSSPTFNAWAKLTAADVHALKQREGFEGQKIYFHLNHPIQWVRLVGVVVSFEKKDKIWILYLDDSSGKNVAVICPRDLSSTGLANPGQLIQLGKGENTGKTVSGYGIDLSPVEVGCVVKVKGGIGEFMREKQVMLERISIVGTTAEELTCWKDLSNFYASVLSKPWFVSPDDVKRFKEAADETQRKRQERARRKKERDVKQKRGKRGKEMEGGRKELARPTE